MDEVILTFWSFNNRFEDEIKHGKRYKEAYESVESYHEQHYGQRRFTSYDAFRKSRERKIRD